MGSQRHLMADFCVLGNYLHMNHVLQPTPKLVSMKKKMLTTNPSTKVFCPCGPHLKTLRNHSPRLTGDSLKSPSKCVACLPGAAGWAGCALPDGPISLLSSLSRRTEPSGPQGCEPQKTSAPSQRVNFFR